MRRHRMPVGRAASRISAGGFGSAKRVSGGAEGGRQTDQDCGGRHLDESGRKASVSAVAEAGGWSGAAGRLPPRR